MPNFLFSQASANTNVPPNKLIRLSLYRNNSLSQGSTASDAFVVNFTHDGFNGLDWRDAPKINNQDENLARSLGQNLRSIENREFPVANEVLPIFINQFSTLTYQLKIEIDQFEGVETVLFDSFTQTTTLLAVGNTIYNFVIDHSVPSSMAFNRFSIRFRPVTLSVNEFEKKPVVIFPNPVISGNVFNIEIPSNTYSSNLNLSVFSLSGKQVYHRKIENKKQRIVISSERFSPGIYLVELTTLDQKSKFTKKLIIK